MRYVLLAATFLTAIAVSSVAPQCEAQAAATGAIEFTARATPSGGQPEPVRQISFYALRTSLADIHHTAQQTNPQTDMDHFIDGLERTPELKAWMKKHHTVDFAGVAFTKLLKADDVIAIPEFLDAYKLQNAAVLRDSVPEVKPKPGEDPDKLAHAKEQYRLGLLKFIAANPESLLTLDAEFIDKNPNVAWTRTQAEEQRRVTRRTLELAQSQYLGGKVSADLDGRGTIAGLPPGTYWLTTLDTPALAGDVRLQWDVPVTVRAGETARVELSNLNALDLPEQTAP